MVWSYIDNHLRRALLWIHPFTSGGVSSFNVIILSASLFGVERLCAYSTRLHVYRRMSSSRRQGIRRRDGYAWPPPPPAPLQHEQAAANIMAWATGRKISAKKLRILLGLLDGDYLISHPIPTGAKGYENLHCLSGKQLRYLFYRHSASVFGWGSRRVEGSSDGFPPTLHAVLRQLVFP